MFIDTHTHLNFQAFADDWEVVVERAIKEGVERMLVVGTDVVTSKRAVEMAKAHEALYAAVGLHPHHTKQYVQDKAGMGEAFERMREDLKILATLAQEERVRAIGEVGLDNHEYKQTKYEVGKDEEEKERLRGLQKTLLTEQVKLAQELRKPLILHSREVGDAVLQLIRYQRDSIVSLQNDIQGVFHCFEGSKRRVAEVVDAGFYVSFTGNITYSDGAKEVAKMVPLDRLLLETDCPYMAPVPYRGERCEPAHVRLVAEAHAESRGIDVDEVMKQTTENAQELFGL